MIANPLGRVLLVQRGPGHTGAGLWCLPCGYVEWGEDVREAARHARHSRRPALQSRSAMWCRSR